MKAWAVSELTGYIQRLLEDDLSLQDVWLAGEVSNFSRSAAGHLYFTLKDAGAALSCVVWRNVAARLAWQPKLGDAALAHGYVSIYGLGGKVQLYADQLLPAGLGDLHARFELLREKLKAEGLFDRERKPLPPFPRLLGIVTSPQAAALRDVLQILQRRYPLVRVLLSPTLVQGELGPRSRRSTLGTMSMRSCWCGAAGRWRTCGLLTTRGSRGPWPPAATRWCAAWGTRQTLPSQISWPTCARRRPQPRLSWRSKTRPISGSASGPGGVGFSAQPSDDWPKDARHWSGSSADWSEHRPRHRPRAGGSRPTS
jgi:hypothetical protein